MLKTKQTRYYKFSRYLKEKYGGRVWKVPVDAGFSCPNKDQNTGAGGCIFCRNDSFSHMQSRYDISLSEQIRKGIILAGEKQGINKYIIYFQSSTNTFAPVELLGQYFNEALAFPGVVGLAIATRPDCLPRGVLSVLEDLTRKTDVWVELGLQSSHDDTLHKINRGHTFQDYLEAVDKLKRLNIRICAHVMIGLPGEGQSHIIATAEKIAASGVHEVKIHPLLVLKETTLEKMYKSQEIRVLELAEYVAQVCDFLEHIPATMVIQRLTAESPPDILISPKWAENKQVVLQGIEAELEKRNTRQGVKCRAE
jgi:uncharacterized protein